MDKFTNPIIMHINYFEQGQTIDYTIRRAKVLGYDGVEFRRARKVPDETPESYVDELARCASRYGMEYILFGGPGINVMTQDEAVIRAEIDGYKHFLDVADKKLNLTVINFMTGWLSKPGAVSYEYETYGSFCAEDWHWETAAKACQEIADYAPHVKFAFETHMGYLHDLATSSRKLVDMIDRPNFGINLDYGNSVYFKKGTYPSLEESIDICGDKLFYTHWKNSVPGSPRRAACALSQGEINHRQYLKKLMEVNFSGLLGVEAPRPGDREFFAREDIEYVKSLIADLNA